MAYTYLIGWSKYDRWYYGVRCANTCEPKDDLWKKYFTSSRYVAEFREEFGEPDVIQIRKTFDNPRRAVEWESRVIVRLKMVEDSRWLNRGVMTGDHLFCLHDDSTKQQLRECALGNRRTLGYTNEYRRQNRMKTIPGKPKSSHHSEEARRKRSESMKGKKLDYFKRTNPYSHSNSTKQKLSEAASHRERFYCETCNRHIVNSNWSRHLSSEGHRLQCS